MPEDWTLEGRAAKLRRGARELKKKLCSCFSAMGQASRRASLQVESLQKQLSVSPGERWKCITAFCLWGTCTSQPEVGTSWMDGEGKILV